VLNYNAPTLKGTLHQNGIGILPNLLFPMGEMLVWVYYKIIGNRDIMSLLSTYDETSTQVY